MAAAASLEVIAAIRSDLFLLHYLNAQLGGDMTSMIIQHDCDNCGYIVDQEHQGTGQFCGRWVLVRLSPRVHSESLDLRGMSCEEILLEFSEVKM